jgi:hypothetical protein
MFDKVITNNSKIQLRARQPEFNVGVVPRPGGLANIHCDAVGFVLVAFGMRSGLCFAVVSSASLQEGIIKLLSGRIKSRFGGDGGVMEGRTLGRYRRSFD